MSGAGVAAVAARVRELLESLGEEIVEDADAFAVRVAELATEWGADADPRDLAGRFLARRVKEARFELKERVLELESLYDLGLALAGTLDIDRLADEILFRSISLTNSRAGALYLLEAGRTILSRSFGGELLPPSEAPRLSLDADGEINNAAAVCPTAGVRLGNCTKCLLVPIQADGRRLGILAVADKETRERGVADYTPSDARLLKLFASQAATALETARLHREAVEKERLERELELAAAIQQEILPREIPAFVGSGVAALNRPTRQVGGDYFDFFSPGNDGFAFVVADVSGKGVPAALLVSTLASALHLQIDVAVSPADLVMRVHRHLLRFSRQRKFATLFLGRYHPDGRLEYVSAGHNPGLLLRVSGAVDELPATGRPIGMFEDSTWEAGSTLLSRGDRLCVYTDGISEAQSAGEEEYGVGRIREALMRWSTEPVSAAARSMLDHVERFARGVPQYDDQTVLLLEHGA
jgi:phosphoserine phosphatase RsbU/P